MVLDAIEIYFVIIHYFLIQPAIVCFGATENVGKEICGTRKM